MARDDRRPASRRVSAARWLGAIVESSDDAIVSKNLDGIVTSWNQGAERIFGYSSEEMIGTSIRRIIPPERQSEEDMVLTRVRAGERVDHFETQRLRKDGSQVAISLTVSPILDDHGVVIGASKIARDITDRLKSETERHQLLELATEQSLINEMVNEAGTVVTSTLDREEAVQAVTDAATKATKAAFGAFFYNVIDPHSGATYQLYALSGAPIKAFASFGHPRATAVFAPTFNGESIIRLDDVTQDPRYGQSAPHFGMPSGHLPVRSYLAVPVRGRKGNVLGALLFGHPEAGRFASFHERVAAGIANWASVALQNAALYVEAQRANAVKDEFLATLSHELRTPLNAILGYSRMLRAGLMTGEKHDRAVTVIERNAGALNQIVEDVLDVSRIVSGKLRLQVQAVDLPAVVNAAIDAVAPAADAKGVRLQRVVDIPAAPVSGDPDRLQQVLWNLLSNAVRYTPRDGKIHVQLLRVNSHVEITVTDTGEGISPEFLPHVFERFRQGDAGFARQRGGLGLGLSIVRDLIELHGGSVEAASAGLKQGATFRIKLPVMAVQLKDEDASRVHPRASGPTPMTALADLRGLTVLAVDDEEDSRRLVREVLEAAGAVVRTAASASEALREIEQFAFDVVVADLGMPSVDGLQLISQIRRHRDPKVRRLAAAALTAYARSEDRAKALQSGFQLHLSKPIDPPELVAAVAALAGRFSDPIKE